MKVCCCCMLPPESSGNHSGVEARAGSKAPAREGNMERKGAAASGSSHRSRTVRSVGVEGQLKRWEVVLGAPLQSGQPQFSHGRTAERSCDRRVWVGAGEGSLCWGDGQGWGLEDSIVIQGSYCWRNCWGMEGLWKCQEGSCRRERGGEGWNERNVIGGYASYSASLGVRGWVTMGWSGRRELRRDWEQRSKRWSATGRIFVSLCRCETEAILCDPMAIRSA